MSESWPLFQSSLSSTPFSGTLADTSSPTPAGELPQVPQANEAPGPSGDRARAEKLKSSEALDAAIQQHSELLKHLNDMKWSKHPESDRWVRRQRLGLNGNKDTEPPEMMYQRFKAMSEVGRNLQTLLEEKRLLNQPSPEEAAMQEGIAKLTVHGIEVSDRKRKVDEANVTLRSMGLPEIPPDKALAFSENPTANISEKGNGPEDAAKAIKAAQDIGQQATPEGITHLPLSMQGPAGDALKAAEKVRLEKKTSEADKTKVAGYPDLKSLRNALNSAYDRHAETLKTEEEGTGMVINPLTFQREKGVVIRKELTPEAATKARQMALDEFPGAENIPELKNYVAGKPVVAGEQKDVSVEDIRARLKAKAAAKAK